MRLCHLIASAVALSALLCLDSAGTAGAASLSCVTINGRTQCAHDVQTDCQVIGDRISCGDRPTAPPDADDAADDDDDASGQVVVIAPDGSGTSLHVEQHSRLGNRQPEPSWGLSP